MKPGLNDPYPLKRDGPFQWAKSGQGGWKFIQPSKRVVNPISNWPNILIPVKFILLFANIRRSYDFFLDQIGFMLN